jgi:hypothetical protein
VALRGSKLPSAVPATSINRARARTRIPSSAERTKFKSYNFAARLELELEHELRKDLPFPAQTELRPTRIKPLEIKFFESAKTKTE